MWSAAHLATASLVRTQHAPSIQVVLAMSESPIDANPSADGSGFVDAVTTAPTEHLGPVITIFQLVGLFMLLLVVDTFACCACAAQGYWTPIIGVVPSIAFAAFALGILFGKQKHIG